jgi:endonuclease YncB( thermonuclease family)
MPRKPAQIFTAHGQVISVHDGDTFKVRLDLLNERELPPGPRVDLGFRFVLESADGADVVRAARAAGVHIAHEINVRLRDVLAPELNTPAGPIWTQVLAALLPPGTTVVVVSRRLDLYGRIEGDVTRWDGLDINAEMRKQTPRGI